MKEEKLFSIGEICRICDIKASRLRYYDNHGVIKPCKIDENNGYRYYNKRTLEEIPVLVYLQHQGFTLKESQEFLQGKSLDKAREMLHDKMSEHSKELFLTEMKINCLQSWIDLIDETKTVLAMDECPISLKYFPEIEAITFSTSNFEGRSFDNLLINTSVTTEFDDEEYHTIGALYLYYPDGNRSNWDDARVYIKNQFHKSQCHKIGGFSAVTCYHRGDFSGIDETVNRMKEWAVQNSFQLRGDLYERSVIDLWTIRNRDQWLMEIYLPVAD